MDERVVKIVEQDPWLKPVEHIIRARMSRYDRRMDQIVSDSGSIVDYSNAHLFFGLHYNDVKKGWVFREWLPDASDVYIFGDFNDWQRTALPLKKEKNGVWSIFLSDENYGRRITHGSLYKILVHGQNGWLERIPAYTFRTYEDTQTHNFSAQVWIPQEDFDWKGDNFDIGNISPLFIYETHIGMAQDKSAIGTFGEFTKKILPYIKSLGYNAVQIMALAEHPYYGSFGYHVSNFFALSSRFGTPEDFKELVRTAHSMGIAVIMDLVHSHYIKNINEGLNELDGSANLYSPPGERGVQKYWDSKTFDYGKHAVEHFLLSNIKYWMEEYHLDGFRFDGVTSMLYYHHGYTDFDSRDKFFNSDVNEDALIYLMLANKLIHGIKPGAVTIAEDVSGMPGIASSIDDGGVGFDYRLAMAIPDFWIELIETQEDERWDIYKMWDVLLNRVPYIKSVAYCESHDQAMVGDKTIAFRLMDKNMYDKMDRAVHSPIIDRGMALHKMIRLFTISAGGDAYMTFMGNEFGHPEWIDFPREGNNWSMDKARRQWSLASNGFLRYFFLLEFDKAMIALIKDNNVLCEKYPYNLKMDEKTKTMVYSHGGLIFSLNWHPDMSVSGYDIPVREPGRYEVILNSDDKKFGGHGRVDPKSLYFSYPKMDDDCNEHHYIKIYNINRAALVFRKIEE